LKLSKQSIQILKNFARINSSIVIDEKFSLKTGQGDMSNPDIIAIANIPEELPVFAFYDLKILLNALNLFSEEEADITFDDIYIKFKQGNNRGRIKTSKPEMIPFKLPHPAKHYLTNDKMKFVGTFDLCNADLRAIKNAAQKLEKDDMVIEIKKNKGKISVTDLDEEDSNEYSTFFSIDNCDEYVKLRFELKDFEVLDGDYKVSVSKDNYIRMINNDMDVTYIICAIKDFNKG
jgi:hypothetical protein